MGELGTRAWQRYDREVDQMDAASLRDALKAEARLRAARDDELAHYRSLADLWTANVRDARAAHRRPNQH